MSIFESESFTKSSSQVAIAAIIESLGFSVTKYYAKLEEILTGVNAAPNKFGTLSVVADTGFIATCGTSYSTVTIKHTVLYSGTTLKVELLTIVDGAVSKVGEFIIDTAVD